MYPKVWRREAALEWILTFGLPQKFPKEALFFVRKLVNAPSLAALDPPLVRSASKD